MRFIKTLNLKKKILDVVQPGRVLRSGRRGRKFKSCHPDQTKTDEFESIFYFFFFLNMFLIFVQTRPFFLAESDSSLGSFF